MFAGLTQAQRRSADPNETIKADGNETELAEQKKHLQRKQRVEIKKARKTKARWRQLKPGMTEEQVQKILGKPKLIQSGSDECVWFYQDLPVSNAKPSFGFRQKEKEQEVKDRYEAVVEKIGLSYFGGVKNGIVFFEAKSIACLSEAEQRSKFLQKLCKEDVAYLIHEEHLKPQVQIECKILDKYNEYIPASFKQERRPPLSHESCRGSVACLIKEEEEKRDKAIAKEKAKCEKAIAKQEEARLFNRKQKRANDMIINKEEIRDNTINRILVRYEAAVKKAYQEYDRRLKNLRHDMRSPVFALRFFNQPDLDRFDELSANIKQTRIKLERQVDRWKKPLMWRKLKIGMTVIQVHALLGEPERSETNVEGRREHYGAVSGHGELYFPAHSDLEEYLDSWIEPFWPAVEKSLHDENGSDTKPKD